MWVPTLTSTGYAFKLARRSIETSRAALSRQTPYFLSKVMLTSCGSKPGRFVSGVMPSYWILLDTK